MGLQLGLSATDNCGNSFTCGYKSGATETIKHLSNLFPKAVVKTSNGKNKVLAPDTAPSGSYKPFDDYIGTIVKANVSMTIKSDSQIGFNPQIFNGSFTDGDIIVSLKDE